MKKLLIATTTAIALLAPAAFAETAPQFSQDEYDLKIMRQQSEAVTRNSPAYMNNDALASETTPYLDSDTEAERIQDIQTGSINRTVCDPALTNCRQVTPPNLEGDSEAIDIIEQQNMQ
jgi:hypothetical protein